MWDKGENPKDIWSTDAWECIKVAFPIRNKGNKVLLTTRNRDVAERIGPNGYHHEQRLLSDVESWELLHRKALRGQPSEGYGDLEALRKEMVKFCGGLPLAVVVLGGILVTKHSFNEWNVVYRNFKSYVGKGESIEQHQGEVQQILALSYKDLPYKLKPCFLYLSGFSEDEDIEPNRLYHLWIAEGMVFAEDRIGDESMMDIAERYLGELAKRSIVHAQVINNAPSIRKFGSCRLHDLMRDLCLEKAREEIFLKAIDYRHGNKIELLTGNVHRLKIYFGEQDAPKYVPPEMEMTKHLRTILFSATEHGDLTSQLAESQFNRFQMLRSLAIEGVTTPGIENIEDNNNSIPDDIFKLRIGNLIHLRYLSLRNSKLVISPSSISNLEHLETLDLYHAKIILTINVPLRMRRLRYLDLNFLGDFSFQIYTTSTLEILRGFHPKNVYVRDFPKLTNLQELDIVVVDEKCLEDIINYISNSHMLKLVKIDYCTFEFLSIEKKLALLRQLFRSNLQHLYFCGYLGKLPEYDSQFFRNLVELKLDYYIFEEDPMAILEKLPKLQNLWLAGSAFVGKEMVCSSTGFPHLRLLVLERLPDLEIWTVEKGAIPNLFRLEIRYCESLTMVPEGLRFIKALKELVIHGMPEEFGKRVGLVDGLKGEDFDKICHIPSIMFNGHPIVLP